MTVAGVCVCAAILSTVLDRKDRVFAMGVGLLAGVAALIAVLRSLRPAAQFLEELSELSGLEGDFLMPILKAVGVGIVAQISSDVCCEGGQTTLARVVELCGVFAAIILTLPLLRSSLELIRQMMTG